MVSLNFPAWYSFGRGSTEEPALHYASHGVMALAWTKDSEGKSLLYERKTTTLPEHLEKLACWGLKPVLGDYYRTYPGLWTAGAVRDVSSSL